MKTKVKFEECPMCGNGEMAVHSDGTYKFMYRRHPHVVSGILYIKCNNCGTSGYAAEQLAANKKTIEDYQNSLCPIFSPSKIVALREKYLLSQDKAAKIFGGGKQAFSKWERGIVTPAEPTAKLMLLAYENPDVMLRLANIAKIDFELPADCQSSSSNKDCVIIQKSSLESISTLLVSFPPTKPHHHYLVKQSSQQLITEFDEDFDSGMDIIWQQTKEKSNRYTLN